MPVVQMGDWRQIQARIRKAKLSADPIPALTRIYDRTRDGMAAFELASVHEAAGRMEEAVGWYTKAWQRFRRDDWKQKAADAIGRLGGAAPQELAGGEPQEMAASAAASAGPAGAREQEFSASEAGGNGFDAAGAEGHGLAETAEGGEESGEEAAGAQPVAGQPGAGEAARESIKKRSRRGRRGGRRHRRKREGEAAAQPASQAETRAPEAGAPAEPAPVPAPPPARGRDREPERDRGRERGRDRGRARERPRPAAPEPQETLPFEGVRVGSEFAAQARAVDPGLASRVARLEAKLRRLMASPPSSMLETEQAPAGPGVFVLSDSDHTTYYYVEACRTLRIALTNIARARTMEGSLKEKFADHLGISESQVGKYIKEHCVARWLQLDDGAAQLAHFAIAVLGPVLNE